MVSGTDEKVFEPRPDLLVVAQEVVRDPEHGEGRDPCGEAGEPHEREADEEGERTPPTAAAIRSDGTFPTVVELRKSKRYGIVAGFSCSGIERTPAAQTPAAKKLMWPNESTPEFPTKT